MAFHRKIDAVKALAVCFIIMHGTALFGQSGWTDGTDVVYTTDLTDKVGIGTEFPAELTHLYGSGATTLKIQTADNTSGSSYSALLFRWGDSSNKEAEIRGIAGISGNKTELGVFVSTLAALDIEAMRIDYRGYVGIGTSNPQSLLAVNGIITAKEVVVSSTGWPDYVFGADYNLMPLAEVAAYIASNGHLPEVPSSEEVAANGINLGESQALLLKKIEELTLYVIEMQKENDLLGQRVATLDEGQ